MGAIPISDLPGHQLLHARVINALDRCQESQGIDFKESAPWESLRWKIICTALAMGNLRDGGIIVIGASEREQTWELTGIRPDHLETYTVDIIIDVINKYASPNLDLDIVRVPEMELNFWQFKSESLVILRLYVRIMAHKVSPLLKEQSM